MTVNAPQSISSNNPSVDWGDQWPSYKGYKSLDRNKREIRLLDVHEASGSSTISIETRHVSLNADPSYCALSYCWGPPVPRNRQVTLLVNGEEVLVRPTLAKFLESLVRQLNPHPVTCWLDALSINQDDLAEKGHQVGMMGTIYSSSQRTFAWLGNGTAETDFVCLSVKENWKFADDDKLFNICIKQILQRPFWSRKWIIQEFVLSQDLTVVVGDSMIGVEDLMRRVPADLLASSHLSALSELRKVTGSRKHLLGGMDKLITSVFVFRGFDCTDARDNLYALLSLVDTNLRPDYNVPTFELIFRVVQTFSPPCNMQADTDTYLSSIRLSRILISCIQSHNEDLISTLQMPDMAFSSKLYLSGEVQEAWADAPKTLFFHGRHETDILGALLYKFRLPGLLSSLIVVVKQQVGIVGLAISQSDVWLSDSRAFPRNKLNLRDFAFLARIMGPGIRVCNKFRYQCNCREGISNPPLLFDTNKLFFIVSYLIDEFCSFNRLHSEESVNQEWSSLIQFLRHMRYLYECSSMQSGDVQGTSLGQLCCKTLAHAGVMSGFERLELQADVKRAVDEINEDLDQERHLSWWRKHPELGQRPWIEQVELQDHDLFDPVVCSWMDDEGPKLTHLEDNTPMLARLGLTRRDVSVNTDVRSCFLHPE